MPSPSILKDYPVLIPYQVDFHTTTTGKHISMTKRHVRWRFGFAHIPSVLSGETGVSCRGIELEAHLVWSVASGKYVLYFNNIPIHEESAPYNLKMQNKFQHSFHLPEKVFPGMHEIFITAWATRFGLPVGQSQFSMFFDGQPFNSFLRIYELGGEGMMNVYGRALERTNMKRQVDGGIGVDNKSPGQGQNHLRSTFPIKTTASDPDIYHNAQNSIRGRMNRNSNDSYGGSDTRQWTRTHSNQTSSSQLPMHQHHSKNNNESAAIGRQNSHYHHSRQQQKEPLQALSSVRPESSQTIHRQRPNTIHNLHAVDETTDLMNFSNDHDDVYSIMRSTSSVTLDTLIQEGRYTNDDDLSFSASAGASHLDPRQVLKTQNETPFLLQRAPPVYGDSLAGDLIQPQPQPVLSVVPPGACVGGTNGGIPATDAYAFAGRHMARPISARTTTSNDISSYHYQGFPQPNFTTAPPPTWEALTTVFANQSQPQTRH